MVIEWGFVYCNIFWIRSDNIWVVLMLLCLMCVSFICSELNLLVNMLYKFIYMDLILMLNKIKL